jgi:hypothetical protein
VTDAESLRREKAWLRKAGVIVLVIGLASAGLVYWMGKRAENSKLDEYEQSRARRESRQMQLLYGQSGGLVEDFFNALKRPGTQAGIIAAITAVIVGGCFYLGRPFEDDSDNLHKK